MSYRIYVVYGERREQLFGNEEYPEQFLDELKRQGCIVTADGCFEKFKIKELAPILEAIDKYIISTEEYFTQKAKEDNEFTLKYLNREPKDSDYDVSRWHSLLTVVNSGCIPTANFTRSYMQGKRINEITGSMLDVYERSYLFIGVRLLHLIGRENLHYVSKFDKACLELNEGIEVYFEAH